jgi:uncharacterized cupin superfamily protein
VIVRWDDVKRGRDIGRAAGGMNVLARRFELGPGETPAQSDPAAEEIIFVTEGGGSWEHADGATDVRAGDCVVRLAGHDGHALRAGDDGLKAFAFLSPLARRAFSVGETGPPLISSLDELEAEYEGEFGKWVLMARPAGAVRSGLNWGQLTPGNSGAPPHCHSADEEVFLILEGSGTLELWPTPVRGENADREEREVRAGDVVWRPPSTGIAHFFRAGAAGMTFLAYGTREPNDVCYYPRSNKIYWRGVGLIGRLEPLGYDDGEPED